MVYRYSAALVCHCQQARAEEHEKVTNRVGASRSVGLVDIEICCDFNESDLAVCSHPVGWHPLSVRASQPWSILLSSTVSDSQTFVFQTVSDSFPTVQTEAQNHKN
ncbi:hypothetical protein V1264_003583 [Littorina saxatilis]|uniref:Uncharacterized protein n=1 Tax=Littorina saxatilis TaxID=31220 RepID=A0AAN9B5A8_9CAEN